jgi:hypothetical protein
LLVSSRQQVRALGWLDRYEALLASDMRDQLARVTSSSWSAVELAKAHFAAIDGLAISDADVLSMTSSVAEKIHGVFLSTVSRAIRASGLTPWSIVPACAKIWPRFFQGGAIGVYKEGSKDARVVVTGNPLVAYRYHRIGWGAHLATTVRKVVAPRVYTRVRHLDESRGRFEVLVQWM